MEDNGVMIVAFSPKKGFFIGCEQGGYGGIEGNPLFRKDVYQALDLSHGRDETIEYVERHVEYILKEAPDAVLLKGTRKEVKNQAAVFKVMES
jgi:hypothetical protein